jgi:HD-like signal output (HDOD) protein
MTSNMSGTLLEKSVADEIARPKYSNLPVLPEVTFRILSMAKDPSSSSEDLQRLISSDIAMSSRILKVVNSAYYGLSRQIGSIERAIVILGRNAVRNIAVAASMVKLFNSPTRSDSGGFNPRQLWLHSTATATAARVFSEHLRCGDPNELFLAGLTHDIGIMAEMHTAHHKLMQCVQEADADAHGIPKQDLRTSEVRWFGLDHQSLGQEVCEYWNFPSMISMLVGCHHTPLLADESDRRTACLIHAADLTAADMSDGFRLDLPSVEIEDDILIELQMCRQELPPLRARIQREMNEVAQLLE